MPGSAVSGTLLVVLCSILFSETSALQCFVCTANRFLNKDCRSLSAARLIDCPDTSDHCNAIVTDIDGSNFRVCQHQKRLYEASIRYFHPDTVAEFPACQVMVNRGCSGNVFSWGFGDTECDIMTNERILDRAVAFYQCRGDGCNNIEPGQVTTVDRIQSNGQQQRVPQFSMNSQLRSEQTLNNNNLVSNSRAIVTDQEDLMRMGKQAQDTGDDSDDSYGLPGRERRTRTSTTTPTPTQPPIVRVVTVPSTLPPIVTRPKRPRHFTVFD